MKNNLLLKLLGLYRKPDERKIEEAKPRSIKTTKVPREYLEKTNKNELKTLEEINSNYEIT